MAQSWCSASSRPTPIASARRSRSWTRTRSARSRPSAENWPHKIAFVAKHRPVQAGQSFVELEESILERWRERDIFHESMRRRADAPTWVFYEGPPPANGRPGSHHVLSRVFKDVFPRYRTMRGFRVDRKAGWDCHGLPVELQIERELGLTNKHEIEAYGVEKFNKRCRESV